jgi:hypothetical protein
VNCQGAAPHLVCHASICDKFALFLCHPPSLFLYIFPYQFERCLFAGKETVHQLYGTRVAVLAGDFMFAQSSWYLANLENLEVIKLISQVNSINFHISEAFATTFDGVL